TTPSLSIATRRPMYLRPEPVSTSNECWLVSRETFTHSTESRPASSVLYSSFPRVSHFTSPVIRSPLWSVSTSVLAARAAAGQAAAERARRRVGRAFQVGRCVTVAHHTRRDEKSRRPCRSRRHPVVV